MKIICTTLNAKYIHTNLAIRYLKAYAHPEFSVDIVEYTIKDPPLNIAMDLMQKHPDVIGFSCYIWNIELTIKIANIIKKIDPNIQIIVGGPEVTYDAYEWMKMAPSFDFIVIGEGEATFKELLQEISGNKNYENVKGIAYRNGDIIRITSPREKIDLRTIPSPFRFEEDIPHLSKRIVYIETSRGCPFTCQFCLSSIEVGVRYFDREKIKDDILFLMKHGAKNFKFVDRTFNISRKYALDMFQFLIDEHLPGTVFQFEITADIMRPEVIEFLNREAPPGLFRFEIGVQSTNDYTNELVQRKQNFEKLKRTVCLIKEGGKIDQHLDLIAGLPEEDYQSFRKTFNDVFLLRPEELQLGFLKMLRGTGLRNRAKEFDYQYMEHPPYEILSNRVLNFFEIIKIKQVEDILEKYWNAHRMDHTIEYLVTHVFPSPFDFFQGFGSYWEAKGWNRIGHQLEDLFKRLYDYLESEEIEEFDIAVSLMKIDYLINSKHKPRTVWWPDRLDKQERSRYYQQILQNPSLLGADFENLTLSEKDLYKHTILEKLPFHANNYLETKQIKRNPSIMLTYFPPNGKKPDIFSFPI